MDWMPLDEGAGAQRPVPHVVSPWAKIVAYPGRITQRGRW